MFFDVITQNQNFWLSDWIFLQLECRVTLMHFSNSNIVYLASKTKCIFFLFLDGPCLCAACAEDNSALNMTTWIEWRVHNSNSFYLFLVFSCATGIRESCRHGPIRADSSGCYSPFTRYVIIWRILVAFILYHKKETKAIFPQAWLICTYESDCNIWNNICSKIQQTLITFVEWM